DASGAVRQRVKIALGHEQAAASQDAPPPRPLAADPARKRPLPTNPTTASGGDNKVDRRANRAGLVAALLAVAATVVVVLVLPPRVSQVVQTETGDDGGAPATNSSAPVEQPVGEAAAPGEPSDSGGESG